MIKVNRIDDLDRFLNMVRKADIVLQIRADIFGTRYSFATKKPYNQENWIKTLDIAQKEEKVISPGKRAQMEDMMKEILLKSREEDIEVFTGKEGEIKIETFSKTEKIYVFALAPILALSSLAWYIITN